MASLEAHELVQAKEQTSSPTVKNPTGEKSMAEFNSQTNYVPKTKIITVAFLQHTTNAQCKEDW